MSNRWRLILVPLVGLIVALGFNFWRLDRPVKFIGDEHYFVSDARHTLNHEGYLDAHPPLGKLEMAGIMAIFGDRPIIWRSLGAIMGALLMPLIWWIAFSLTKKRRAGDLAMLAALMSGIILVESRSAMINIPYVFYALAALAAILVALCRERYWPWIILAGLLAGLSISVKWLALFIYLPTILLWCWPAQFGQTRKKMWDGRMLWWTVGGLVVLPVIVYIVIWQIHFALTGLEPQTLVTNIYLFMYQTTGKTEHLYRLEWWQWPLMLKQFPYYTERVGDTVSKIWSMPNPWLWWTGWLALGWAIIRCRRDRLMRGLGILLIWSWLPFAFIKRSMFIYHALPFMCLLSILIGVIGARLWERNKKIIITYLAIALLVFIWFCPWFLNIKISTRADQWRRWLPSWTLRQS